ncbi:MAG: DUF2130 domain-containing protein [Saprospiraceae bacterium]|nr:DUF2130 domain-containing protein [Saprospiraceae bacterium]
MDKIQHINCPKCNHEFDVEDVLAAKLQNQFKAQYEADRKALEAEHNKEAKKLNDEIRIFEDKKKRENEIFEKKLLEKLGQERANIRKKIEEDFSGRIKLQQEEIEKKQKQLAELRNKELELEKMKLKMNEQEKEIELRFQKKMAEELLEREEKIQKRLNEGIELKLREKDKQLEDHKKLIEELKRKSEQGSMQLQGEVQEMAIEEYLAQQFPFDTIEEIKKGARGGDCLQIVNTRSQNRCGTIYYESKRTKDFQPSWIEKFKADIRNIGADIGVLVTQALPKDMNRMGMKNGIWICSYQDFKGLSLVLRDSLVKISEVKSAESNKGDKMEMLYSYLTSNEFKLMIEGIVEGFTQMQNDLVKEKNAMHKIWNQREKQIQKVLLNTTGLYGSIKGIAGNAVGNISALELPE